MKMTHKNGTMWYDTAGAPIQAHGGMILKFQDTYYWYGENKNGATHFDAAAGLHRVDFIGFSCYSSADCVNWTYEGLALKASENPSHTLSFNQVGERPKVLYNQKTKKFVMWFHLDSRDYLTAQAGIAVSDSPTGPFSFLGGIHPNGYDCRDMTLFQDTDKKAYLIYSSDWNKTLRIAQLTDDFTDVNGIFSCAFPGQEREAPAVFQKDGVYYMITSGCTGWHPNSALLGISKTILSGWKLIDNPCVGAHARQTFFGQSSYVFEKEGAFYLMLDHWKPEDLKTSGYSILPVTFEEDGVTIRFQEYTKF